SSAAAVSFPGGFVVSMRMRRLRRSVTSARKLVTATRGAYWGHGRSLLGCRVAARRRGRATITAAPPAQARRVRGAAARARRRLRAPARDRRGPRALVDLLRTAGIRKDDARADRRGEHRRRLRRAVRGLGDREGRPRGAGSSTRAARHEREPY